MQFTKPLSRLEKPLYNELRNIVPENLPPVSAPNFDSAARKVSIADNGAPLLLVQDTERVSCRYAYTELPLRSTANGIILRKPVIDHLARAASCLPGPLSLILLDGWRSVELQHELGNFYRKVYPDISSEYVADATDNCFLPPHTLGAAVDLTIGYKGNPLSLGSDFDEFNERSSAEFLEKEENLLNSSDVLNRDLRRLLAAVLRENRFTPLHSEWWHYSLGDQRWAAFNGVPSTLFGQVAG